MTRTHRIADQLCPDLLALTTSRLIRDIRNRYGCTAHVAMAAVFRARARKA